LLGIITDFTIVHQIPVEKLSAKENPKIGLYLKEDNLMRNKINYYILAYQSIHPQS
jgi:hypothetical protein